MSLNSRRFPPAPHLAVTSGFPPNPKPVPPPPQAAALPVLALPPTPGLQLLRQALLQGALPRPLEAGGRQPHGPLSFPAQAFQPGPGIPQKDMHTCVGVGMMLMGDFQKGGPPLFLGPRGPSTPKVSELPALLSLPRCTDGPCVCGPAGWWLPVLAS